MANKNKHVMLAYFTGADKADRAANQIMDWDEANDDIKLGGIGILSWEEGKMKTRKVGARATSKGAKWGLALGAVTGILTGGVTLVGGAIAGVAGGALVGALFHRNLGLTDDDRARLEARLQDGGAALVIMGDEHEVEPTEAQLVSLGGEVENYMVPEETMTQVEAAAEIVPVEADVEGMVNVPGTWQSAQDADCADWDPACSATRLTEQEDGSFTGTFPLPAGDYEVKVAVGGSWGENYGVGGESDGPNIDFRVGNSGEVTFAYDPATHLLTIA